MLVRLFGSNFRSFKSPFELSTVAADLTREDDRDRGVMDVPIEGLGGPLRLLRSIAIYGANASGKSTVLAAGHALNWLVTLSSRNSLPGSDLPVYEPFLLDDQARNGPVSLGCEVVCDKKLVSYEVTYQRAGIQREVLELYDDKEGTTKLIDRRPSGEVAGTLFASGNVNKLYVEEMQPNVAVLSKLAQHAPRNGRYSVGPYFEAIRKATRFADYTLSKIPDVRSISSDDERFADDAEYREWIMRHLIQAADVGICDVQAIREKNEFPDLLVGFAKRNRVLKLPDQSVVVSFVHAGASNQPIDFHLESSGTKKLFHIAADWWRLGNSSATLLADELGAGLHPRLLGRLIRAVNEPIASGGKSQLIFTTHDVGLLEGQDGMPPALRRDQVYFTKKDASGASELYALAEFKDEARPVHNLRKRYMSGRYGAIPSAEGVSL